MSVKGTAAYGMYPRNVALPEVVYALNRAGFENEDICMVLSPAHPVATMVRDAKILDAKSEESATSARLIGWFSEFGAVVIPTLARCLCVMPGRCQGQLCHRIVASCGSKRSGPPGNGKSSGSGRLMTGSTRHPRSSSGSVISSLLPNWRESWTWAPAPFLSRT
jgi:hypothetical protein